MHHRGVAQAVILAVPHSVFNQIVLVPYRNVDYVRCRAEYPKFEFNFPFCSGSPCKSFGLIFRICAKSSYLATSLYPHEDFQSMWVKILQYL